LSTFGTGTSLPFALHCKIITSGTEFGDASDHTAGFKHVVFDFSKSSAIEGDTLSITGTVYGGPTSDSQLFYDGTNLVP
jgi:hypothetical protein